MMRIGIAVGEIKTVLDEADIQQISMRIIFVLKVQNTLNQFNWVRGLSFLNIRYERYNYTTDEFKYIKSKDRVVSFVRKRFFSSEPNIKLVDPIKRLEDSVIEMSRATSYDLKSIRDLLTMQLGDVETKLSNSQQRLEDCLVEMSRKTKNNFESTEEATTSQLAGVGNQVADSQNAITTNIHDLNTLTTQKMDELKETYDEQVESLKEQINENVERMTEQVSSMMNEQIAKIATSILTVFEKLDSMQSEMDKIRETQATLLDLNKKMESQFANYAIEQNVKEALKTIVDQLIDDNVADVSDGYEEEEVNIDPNVNNRNNEDTDADVDNNDNNGSNSN
jgi:hypothetical protein